MCNGSEKWCLPLDDSPPISRAYPFWVDVIHNVPVDICKLSSRGPINIHLTTFLLKILEIPAEAEPENRFEPILFESWEDNEDNGQLIVFWDGYFQIWPMIYLYIWF